MIDQPTAQRRPAIRQNVDGLHHQPVRQVIRRGDPVAHLIGDVDLPLVQPVNSLPAISLAYCKPGCTAARRYRRSVAAAGVAVNSADHLGEFLIAQFRRRLGPPEPVVISRTRRLQHPAGHHDRDVALQQRPRPSVDSGQRAPVGSAVDSGSRYLSEIYLLSAPLTAEYGGRGDRGSAEVIRKASRRVLLRVRRGGRRRGGRWRGRGRG